MPLQKQSAPMNFGQGLDLKTDDKQVPFGKFLRLQNTIFTKGGLLQKRNGFPSLASLPNNSSTFATTFNGNLTAIGTSLQAYSSGSKTWVNKGSLVPVQLSTLPLIRTNNNQTQADSVVAPNGLICTAYTDSVAGSPVYKYVVADSVTGQNVVAPTIIANASGSPRMFLLGNYFIIVFSATISAAAHLQYLAINVNTLAVIAATDISTAYTPSSTVGFDAVVANNGIYVAWNGNDGGGAIRITLIDSTLLQHNTVVFAGKVSTLMSVCADTTGTTAIIYVSFYNSGSSTGFTLAVNQQLNTVFAPVSIISSGTILNLASAAQNGVATVFYETSHTYSYDSGIASNFVSSITITQAGSAGSPAVVLRSVGLASKAFISSGTIYFLSVYGSSFQPTYFLSDSQGRICAKLAYSNGGGYLNTGLPSVLVTNGVAQVSYLIRDMIIPVNKMQGASNAGAGVFAQTGINLCNFTIASSNVVAGEIGSNLNLSGGFLWAYDGFQAVEQNFFLWPDSVELTGSTSGGTMTAQQYFYQVTYEWSDNQGNIQRSAPSIPVTVTTTGSTSSVTVNIPTLRLTYKTANPVSIVVYRWSAGQQTYYQTGTVTNSTTTDSVSFVDTHADSAIIGNNILYTTGGVVEDIGPPPTSTMTLYKSRLVLVDSEDQNLLWYSKQVIEATPVEMSDLFTIYVAPTQSAQGSTGPITALSAMDDKLIIFKKDAIYYLTGTGPDNTGANNDFSDPVFITSTVGCANQHSIVFMPQGLMFQSDKGIWLLGRDLSTTYIGAPVENFNSYLVQSSVNVPATNQVRFTLSNGTMLMYDYFFGLWGTFVGVPAISSTIFQGLHTYINSSGQVFQEQPGTYLDGSNPVLMSFTTGWLSFAGLQGFQRAYWFNFVGTYLSPHTLTVKVAYDFSLGTPQATPVIPDNFNPVYGADPNYGSAVTFGGNTPLEEWEVYFEKQKCQNFQIAIDESFDSSKGVVAGAGLTLSGLNFIYGAKGNYPRLKASRSVG